MSDGNANERTLTTEDREKVQRLLETGQPESVRLAISLLEQTGSDQDIDELFTNERILSLISSGDVHTFTLTTGFLMERGDAWQRLFQAVTKGVAPVEPGEYSEPSIHARCLCCNWIEEIWIEEYTDHSIYLDYITLNKEVAWTIAERGWLHVPVEVTLPNGEKASSLLLCLSCISNFEIVLTKEIADRAVEHAGGGGPGSRSIGGSGMSLGCRETEFWGPGYDSENECVCPLIPESNEPGVVLPGKAIENDAAEVLGNYEGNLFLPGLTSLSDVAAENLVKHKRTLFLNGLTSLSDTAAESLGKHSQEEDTLLYLDGLTELSDAAAESLSRHEGSLTLHGLTSLSDLAAESLSKHEGDLYLEGLTELSDAAAESLSKRENKFNSWQLTLDNLPKSAAKILRDAGHGE